MVPKSPIAHPMRQKNEFTNAEYQIFMLSKYFTNLIKLFLISHFNNKCN